MQCPACGKTLAQQAAGEIVVDVCGAGCGGIWFDAFELEKVDDAHESAGEALLDTAPDQPLEVDCRARRNCPRCADTVMMRHFFGVKREVEIDECPGCGGIWLDRGELGAIRSQFASEAEKDRATQAWLEKNVGTKLEEMRVRGQAERQRAERFARAMRVICPSFYAGKLAELWSS